MSPTILLLSVEELDLDLRKSDPRSRIRVATPFSQIH